MTMYYLLNNVCESKPYRVKYNDCVLHKYFKKMKQFSEFDTNTI
jgi:hypothetical protein